MRNNDKFGVGTLQKEIEVVDIQIGEEEKREREIVDLVKEFNQETELHIKEESELQGLASMFKSTYSH